MTREVETWRRLLTGYLLAALPALSCTIPILDLMVGDGNPAVEAQHHPGTHGYPHNHLICIQQQANQWVMPSHDLLPRIVAAVLLPALPDRGPSYRSTQLSLPYSRAPPLF
jgi:hypothetical protein